MRENIKEKIAIEKTSNFPPTAVSRIFPKKVNINNIIQEITNTFNPSFNHLGLFFHPIIYIK